MTQRELKPIIKKEVDEFITELMSRYPKISKSSLETFIIDEARTAMFEIDTYNRILTNTERYGTEKKVAK